MRARIVFPLLLFAGIILLLAGWFHPQSTLPTTAVPEPTVMTPVEANLAIPAAVFQETPQQFVTLPTAVIPAENAVAATDDPDVRIATMQTQAMNDDTNSLNLILLSLNDPDPQIRAAALEAAIQFDSPDAIQPLQDALAKTEPPQEKVHIQEAIDFLRLPPLTLNGGRNSSR